MPLASIRRVMSLLGAGAFFAGPAPAQRPAGQEGVSITFLANEGVMLSSGGKKVLIDGLFLRYGPDFAVPADSTQAALRTARAPFDAVDLILVTHRHGDHFHPETVAAHLRANPRATLLTSKQVIDSLRGRVPANDPVASRSSLYACPRLGSRLMARRQPLELVIGVRVPAPQ